MGCEQFFVSGFQRVMAGAERIISFHHCPSCLLFLIQTKIFVCFRYILSNSGCLLDLYLVPSLLRSKRGSFLKCKLRLVPALIGNYVCLELL